MRSGKAGGSDTAPQSAQPHTQPIPLRTHVESMYLTRPASLSDTKPLDAIKQSVMLGAGQGATPQQPGLDRDAPLLCEQGGTHDVFPWSTCASTHMLRMRCGDAMRRLSCSGEARCIRASLLHCQCALGCLIMLLARLRSSLPRLVPPAQAISFPSLAHTWGACAACVPLRPCTMSPACRRGEAVAVCGCGP